MLWQLFKWKKIKIGTLVPDTSQAGRVVSKAMPASKEGNTYEKHNKRSK